MSLLTNNDKQNNFSWRKLKIEILFNYLHMIMVKLSVFTIYAYVCVYVKNILCKFGLIFAQIVFSFGFWYFFHPFCFNFIIIIVFELEFSNTESQACVNICHFAFVFRFFFAYLLITKIMLAFIKVAWKQIGVFK